MRPFHVDPADLFASEGAERLRRATDDFPATEITEPGALFDAAYGALWGYFGHKNEIERKDVLEDWLHRPVEGRVRVSYHLIAWHDRDGKLAGVRDCFVGIDREAAQCGVLLSHSFVLPDYRRSGVATPIRTAPASIARAQLRAQGLDPRSPVLLAAEMEPVVPADEASIVRLFTYGRTGYGVIPPAVLPYCQPDFRTLASGADAVPIAMPLVVRWLDHEAERAVPPGLVGTLIETLELLHLRACEPTHVLAMSAVDRERLGRLAGPIPLIQLPTRLDEIDRLEPLLRSRALHHYPASLRVDLPDPDADLAELRNAGRRMAT